MQINDNISAKTMNLCAVCVEITVAGTVTRRYSDGRYSNGRYKQELGRASL